MTKREKKLALLVGIVAVGFALLAGLRALLLQPIREIERDRNDNAAKLSELKNLRQRALAAKKRLAQAAELTFSEDLSEAGAESAAHLHEQIVLAGLDESRFERQPVGPRPLRGGRELGWSLSGEGPIDKIINLLYLLQADPYLHRVERISVTPGRNKGDLKLRCQYLTLVLDPCPAVRREPLELASLEGEPRKKYEPLVQRNFLLPYIKPPEPPRERTARRRDQEKPQEAPAPPGPEVQRVVSLSAWGDGGPRVHIFDRVLNQMLVHKIGETIAVGQIVMIDYRPLPLPDKPQINSLSRLILRENGRYWAVEIGRTLAERYPLEGERIPPELRAGANPPAPPAAKPVEKTDAPTPAVPDGLARPTAVVGMK